MYSPDNVLHDTSIDDIKPDYTDYVYFQVDLRKFGILISSYWKDRQ